MWILLRRLAEAEHVNHAISGGRASSHGRVLAAPVAEDVPGDLRRAPDEEVEAPDVLAVVARQTREDGAPPKREAPEPKDLRARSPVVRPPTAGGADPDDDGPQRFDAVVGRQLHAREPCRLIQNLFDGIGQ